MNTSNEKSTAALLHLSTLSQYIIPFGNYIFPIIIWSSKKNESKFIDYNGKQVLNFQLSLLLYTLILLLITVPIVIFTVLNHYTITGFNHDLLQVHSLDESRSDYGVIMLAITAIAIFGLIKIFEFILIIYGAVKASNGNEYKYPLSIPFFK